LPARADVTPPPGDITALLLQLDGSGQNAVDRIFPYVYDHLKAIARRRLRAEREGHTLSATALVHEAYFKLVDQERVVELRFFAGMKLEEIAEVLQVSLASVNRDWRTARAFLTTQLAG